MDGAASSTARSRGTVSLTTCKRTQGEYGFTPLTPALRSRVTMRAHRGKRERCRCRFPLPLLLTSAAPAAARCPTCTACTHKGQMINATAAGTRIAVALRCVDTHSERCNSALHAQPATPATSPLPVPSQLTASASSPPPPALPHGRPCGAPPTAGSGPPAVPVLPVPPSGERGEGTR